MWSFVQNKDNQHWLWLAIDHKNHNVLAYTFGRRQDKVFIKMKILLDVADNRGDNLIFSRDNLNCRDFSEPLNIELNNDVRANLISILEEHNFFPNTDDDIVWVAEANNEEIGWYKLKQNSYSISCSFESDPKIHSIHFKLYKSFEERAEYIFKMFKGNKIKMYYSGGYLNEYDDYKITTEKENVWINELKEENNFEFIDIKSMIKEEHEELSTLLIRPGMYVGKPRLDLLQIYYNGMAYYCYKCSKCNFVWNLDYDMQKWFLVNESISILHAASLNAWSLFHRCFGVEELAIQKFRQFLTEAELNSIFDKNFYASASMEIYSIYSKYKYKPLKKKVNPIYKKYIGFKSKDLSKKKKHKYNILVKQIEKIIGLEYKKLKIYICYDNYFLQVKFFVKDIDNKWIEDIAFLDKEDYYEKLVIIHGLVSVLIQDKENIEESILFDKVKNTIYFNEKKLSKKIIINNFFDGYVKKMCFYDNLMKWKDKNNFIN